MPYQSVYVDVTRYGPLFDGRAEIAVEEFERTVTRRAAEIGRDWIRIASMAMDKSGRGSTGIAAHGVLLTPIPAGWSIFGAMVKGRVWWPWLEGTSRRNSSSKFKGYHTFRSTKYRLNATMPAIAEVTMAEYIGKMGGTVA